ncbi:hypothetical protein V8C35DRAFT_306082 [Trichoderma chlorosporum]
MMNKIIVGALGLVASVAATPLEFAERSSCRDDSLYKCFVDREYSHSASAYCSALTPVSRTVTVVKPTVTKTVWATSTATALTDFISATTTVYTATVPSSTATETETATATATLTVTQGVTVTATVTGGQAQQPPTTTVAPLRRGAQGEKPEPPKCMLTKCFVYSPERITAACDCINVPPRTVTVHQTVPRQTITVTSISATTPDVTATAWQTVATELADGVSTTTATVTTTVSTTVTTTATTTITTTVAPPQSTANLIPNGDFSNGLTGWTVLNSSPGTWVNLVVSNVGSPDGTSKTFQATNVAFGSALFIASPSFGLQASSSYTVSFMVRVTSPDPSLLTGFTSAVNCGSFTLAQPKLSQATQGANSYYTVTATFDTPTTTDSSTLSQLGSCQVQLGLPVAQRPPVTWLLANVSAKFAGSISA